MAMVQLRGLVAAALLITSTLASPQPGTSSPAPKLDSGRPTAPSAPARPARPRSAERDTVLSTSRCPGTPDCSGHGQCRRNDKNKSITHLSCKCDQGFLGHECARKERDCSAMRTCGECQDHANRRFCGWCATSRYCVPKHVQRALLKNSGGKNACGNWYEDSCPASPPQTGATSSVPLTIDADETSLQLAAALVSMIDGGGTRGNGWIGSLIVVILLIFVFKCVLHEHEVSARRRKFAAYMHEEACLARAGECERLEGDAHGLVPGWQNGMTPLSALRALSAVARTPSASPGGGRRPFPMNAVALADALGSESTLERSGEGEAGDEDGGEGVPVSDEDPAASSAAAEAAEAAALEASIREASRKD